MPKIRLPESLPVYRNCVRISVISREAAISLIADGVVRPVGTRRRVNALHYIDADPAGIKKLLKLRDKTVQRDEFRMWEHSRTAHQWNHHLIGARHASN